MNKYIIKNTNGYKFNSFAWISDKKLNKRRIIYLDLNHWINLMHGNDPTSREILVLLNDLRRIKAIECATTLAQALEIGKLDNEISRNLLASFVDRMTNGLSVRRRDQLLFFEFEFISKSQWSLAGPKLTEPDTRSFAFTHLIGSLGVPELHFPTYNIFSEQAVEMSEGIFDSILSSAIYVISKTFSNRKASFEDQLNSSWTRIRDRLMKEQGKGENFENALKQELDSGLKILVKVITNNYEDNSSSKSRFKNIDCITHETIQMIPSLNTLCKLYAAFRSAGKNPKNSDAYDLMTASLALPYVDIYATDKHVKYLATEILSLDEDYNTLVISKAIELLKALKDITVER